MCSCMTEGRKEGRKEERERERERENPIFWTHTHTYTHTILGLSSLLLLVQQQFFSLLFFQPTRIRRRRRRRWEVAKNWVLLFSTGCHRQKEKETFPSWTKTERESNKCFGGDGYRSHYLSHAKRALYHLSYTPVLRKKSDFYIRPIKSEMSKC